jgi:hypothetical protein
MIVKSEEMPKSRPPTPRMDTIQEHVPSGYCSDAFTTRIPEQRTVLTSEACRRY